MLQLSYQPHQLQFRFEAGTSRGVLTHHQVYYLHLSSPARPGCVGWGEAAPLRGLSVDDRPDFAQQLAQGCAAFTAQGFAQPGPEVSAWVRANTTGLPSLRFALETALLDWANGGQKVIFDNFFVHGQGTLPINGLVWMGPEAFMRAQVEEKLAAGYRCLKLKIGALDFDRELALLHDIRQRFGPDQVTLRVDANGAFAPAEAPAKLQALARYHLHSIEQPIRAGQPDQMADLCAHPPLPIALDEELIGVQDLAARRQLLAHLRPQYLVLKPTLLGGLADTAEWIGLAGELGLGWWVTSALESNVGLNAICQFTAQYRPTLPQGLGTGQLYHNNLPSPLYTRAGTIGYAPAGAWGEVT
jgi:o-succinylbenzoate synthase